MAKITMDVSELFKGYDVLLGGIKALDVEDLSGDEETRLTTFIEDSIDALDKISPEIAKDFEAQEGLILNMTKVFKAKVSKPFGGILPSSGQFGVGLIIPQDIKYAATASASNPCYTGYTANSWNISLTAGTAAYLLGDGTNFYKARPTTNYRTALLIIKNGIVEVGTSPSINQFQPKTERVSYPAFSVHPLVDQPVERGYQIYRYNFPFAMPVFHDFGVMLGTMPIATRTADIRLVGVVLYEYSHRASLRYVS